MTAGEHHAYYIVESGGNDGPHDLITIMRRIHAKKILADTLIYIDGTEKAVPATDIPEIALFFRHGESPAPVAGGETIALSLYRSIADGWRFTHEHNVMTVYAGGLLLIGFLLGAGLVNALGVVTGGMLGWVAFLVLHHFYLLFALRICRGQTVGSDFVNQQIAPVLPTLLLSFVMLALMTAGGMLLLVIPGVAVMTLYIFVPFLVLDHHYRPAEAMHASRLLLLKHGAANWGRIACLVALHLVCLVLILPVPITLPVFAASLARIYEELSAS